MLLPLVTEEVNSHAAVRHSIDRIIEIIEKINPGQVPVITGDQPVYALGKQVQWMMEKYTNVIWMLGALHIEMTWLGVLGDWLDGGSWTELYDMSKISTSGRVDSFLKGSFVKSTFSSSDTSNINTVVEASIRSSVNF